MAAAGLNPLSPRNRGGCAELSTSRPRRAAAGEATDSDVSGCAPRDDHLSPATRDNAPAGRPGAVPSLPVPNLASVRGDALIIAASSAVATVAALLVDRATGISAPFPPLAAAAVVAAIFWWRPPIGLLAFGVFALLAGTIEHWLDLDLLLFDEIGLALLVMVAIGGRHLRAERIRGGWLEAFLGVLAAAAVASSLAAGVPPLIWIAGMLLLFKGVAFFYLARWVRLTADDALRMGLVVLLIAGGILVTGFIELIDPPAFQRALGLPVFELRRGEVPVIRGLFLHPALFGWLTAFASLLCYARFLTHRTWWAAPLGLLFNVGTFLSGRRTPL